MIRISPLDGPKTLSTSALENPRNESIFEQVAAINQVWNEADASRKRSLSFEISEKSKKQKEEGIQAAAHDSKEERMETEEEKEIQDLDRIYKQDQHLADIEKTAPGKVICHHLDLLKTMPPSVERDQLKRDIVIYLRRDCQQLNGQEACTILLFFEKESFDLPISELLSILVLKLRDQEGNPTVREALQIAFTLDLAYPLSVEAHQFLRTAPTLKLKM